MNSKFDIKNMKLDKDFQSKQEIRIQWPECFKTGIVDPKRHDAALCSDALEAWAATNVLSIFGEKLPDCFGTVMSSIARRLGVIGTPESFAEWGDRWMENRD